MMILWSLVLSCAGLVTAVEMNVVYQWNKIIYDWLSPEHEQAAIRSGAYIDTNVFPIDVDVAQNGLNREMFMTTPRLLPGVPASLSTLENGNGEGTPALRPFPDWSWHNRTDCKGLTSVWRTTMDECKRLWVLDSGKIGDHQVCPAQILAFDLATREVVRRIIIPNELLRSTTTNETALLVTIAVESHGRNCARVWVYVADVNGRGLIITDGSRIWRLNGEDEFGPDPNDITFSIAGESFDLADGVLALAISPKRSDGLRYLYWRALAERQFHCAPLDDMHESYRRRPYYETSSYKLPSQAGPHAFTPGGILFYGLTTQMSLSCWNINEQMNERTTPIVSQNNQTLQFISGIKVRDCYNGRHQQEVFIVTNRFQKIMNGNQNFNETNFRVLARPVPLLTDGTVCQEW